MKLLAHLLAALLMLTPVAARAQTDDKGYLTRLLEENLSSQNAQVQIDGFAGALSSVATIKTLTISDQQGVWLRAQDLSLAWSRSALLQGRVDIEQIKADTIDLLRRPATASDSALPSPEAPGFSLPKLPVSVDLRDLEIRQITLPPELLGQAVQMRVSGAAQLISGSGRAELLAERTDGTAGRFDLKAAYEAAEQRASVDLRLREDGDGLATARLNLPAETALDLSLIGEGPLDDFSAQLELAANNTRRLGGTLTLRGLATGGRRFSADLAGDLTTFFAPQYRPFFGAAVSLTADGVRAADGAFTLNEMALKTAALQLAGRVSLTADGWPRSFDLSGRLEDPGAASVQLPFGEGLRVGRADLRVVFDAATGNAWQGSLTTTGFEMPDLQVGRAQLTATGTIEHDTATVGQVTARTELSAAGLVHADPAYNRAIGRAVQGQFDLAYRQGAPLALRNIDMTAAGVALAGDITVRGLGTGYETRYDLALRTRDLQRFSGLAGSPLRGTLDAQVSGSAAPLAGQFDTQLTGTGTNLAVGVEAVDNLLRRGSTKLNLSAQRDENGLTVPALSLIGADYAIEGDAKLSSRSGQARLTARLDRTELIAPQLRGRTRAQGDLRLKDDIWSANLQLNAPLGITATVDGQLTGAAPALRYTARLPNIQPLIPALSGAASITGQARQAGGQWRIAADVTAPAGARATLAGTVGDTVNLTAKGNAPLALANPKIPPRTLSGLVDFDLAVQGRLALDAVRGRLSTTGARLTLPTLRNEIEQIAGSVALNNGTAQLDLNGRTASGGRLSLSGPVTLSGQFPADLTMTLRDATLTDPKLYSADLTADMSLRGPLLSAPRLSGRIGIPRAEVRVASSGFGAASELPSVQHINVPRPVKRTLKRAGLAGAPSEDAAAGAGPNLTLDILLNAPSRLFVRGRGVDAELGGNLRLTGTPNALVSTGRFELIRGRMDVLGKRFSLAEGQVQLDGDLDPSLRFVATTETDRMVASVVIGGRASAPTVTFESSPELAQDEVVAQLFFGKNISELSALEALKLANSIAVLSGRAGVGLIENLRAATALDDLDVATDDTGATSVKAGKYLSENAYTDITVSSGGRSKVNLNIDLSTSTTLRGSVDNDGNTSLGVFFERDY